MAQEWLSEDDVREAARDDACAVCGERLGRASYELHNVWAGRAHGPCKAFDEQRRDAGYPEARTRVELKRMIRAGEARRG